MMKTAAIAMNLAQLLLVVYILATLNSPLDAFEYVLLATMIVTPVVTLLALKKLGDSTWLGLYFERRRLEEQRKIDALKP